MEYIYCIKNKINGKLYIGKTKEPNRRLSEHKILSGYGIESDIKQKQEEALPLGKSVIPDAQPSLVVG